MNSPVRFYIAAIVGLGTLCALPMLTAWKCADPLQFAAYLLLAVLTAAWKVNLPGMHGTLSASFIYVILSVVELGREESLWIGGFAALVQYTVNKKSRFQFSKASFNVAVLWISITFAALVTHHPVLVSWGVPLPIRTILGTSAYFVGNTLSVSLVIAATNAGRSFATWRDCHFWSLPYYLLGGTLVVVIHEIGVHLGWATALFIAPAMYLVYRYYSRYLERLRGEKEHAEAMAGLHLRTIEALALAIDAKDESTQDHLRRVQIYCMELGKLLGLTKDELDALHAASLLHDIGKLAVPEHILSKPGKLTAEEFAKVKIHPLVAAEILERVKFPYPVVPIVRHHHEAWDGSGYPDGLKGEEIPMGARILGAVDCLDAVASDRAYRPARTIEQALAVVQEESGRRYDPKVVAVLSELCMTLEKKARKQALDLRDQLSPRSSTAVATQTQSTEFLRSIGSARREAQLIYEITQALAPGVGLPEMLGPIVPLLREPVPFDTLAIYLAEEDRLKPVFVSGLHADSFLSLSLSIGAGLSGRVARTRKPVLNGNPALEFAAAPDEAVVANLRSALAVPLEGANGLLGIMTLYRRAGDAFHQDQLRILMGLGSRLGLAIESSVRFQRAQQESTTDYLTGLYNTRALFERLETLFANSRKESLAFSILVCDLDRFKYVNDRYGHVTGNQILQSVATVLHSHCRPCDFAGRLGGDEFVLVLDGLSAAHAEPLAARIRAAVSDASTQILGSDGFSISIGCASFPGDGGHVNELLAEADRKMYVNKQQRDQGQAGLVELIHSVENFPANAPGKALQQERSS